MFNDKLVIFTNKNTIYQSKLKLIAIFGQSRSFSNVIHLKQQKTPKSGFHEIFREKRVRKQFVSGLL
jgi:hypothetical protein